MRGIPEERLKVIAAMPASVFEAPASEIINYLIAKECQELQEQWMTLEEFLKSGFEGQCWMYSVYKDIFVVQFIDDNFISINTGAKTQLKYIERVMPIHKPEPPI